MKNKVVVITGSSRGIGRAAALLFAQRGAYVVINSRQSDKNTKSLLAEINQLSKGIHVEGDVANEGTIQALHEAAIKEFGRVDVLINNAAVINQPNAWNDFTQESFLKGMETNLLAPMRAVRIFADSLKKAKGNIINVSSTYGLMGGAPVAVYTASKSALINYTMSMAVELAPDIRVNAIAPGVIDTDMTAGAPKEFIDEVIQRTPLKRLGQADEIAKCLAFLASDEASFVTGHTFIADGGHILLN